MLALLKPLSHSTKRRNEHSIRATDLDPNREGRAAIHFASLGGLASGDTLKDYGPNETLFITFDGVDDFIENFNEG